MAKPVKDLNSSIINKLRKNSKDASLTVEAALVMPIFLYLMFALIYFIQIFMLQEQLQSSITKMALSLSRTAYFYKDFPDINEALDFDKEIFGEELREDFNDYTDRAISGLTLRLLAGSYLNKDWLNKSCIVNGFDGLDFQASSLNNDENCIDIIIKYQVKIPVKVFVINNINLLQRVRLRAWTGLELTPAYESEKLENKDITIVYITRTGSVYHKNKECSHIKLSVRKVQEKPDGLRNDNGARYYPCEACCTGKEGIADIYYITSDGTRYHTRKDCSKIKRDIKEIPITEVGSRKPCSRCSK